MEYHSNNSTKGDGSAAVNAASDSKNRKPSSDNLSLQSGGVTIHSRKLALSDDTNKLTN